MTQQYYCNIVCEQSLTILKDKTQYRDKAKDVFIWLRNTSVIGYIRIIRDIEEQTKY